MSSFHETMTSFVWNVVEFVANLAVIFYVGLKLGYINPPRVVKNDVPATLADQVRETASFVKTFGEVVTSMKSMLPTTTPPAATPPTVTK